MDVWMDGWVDDLRFMSFLIVFQSYQDDRRVLRKCCLQVNHRRIYLVKLTNT